MAHVTREHLLHLVGPLPDGEFELWVAERWIESVDPASDDDRFDFADIARARLLRDLRLDLELDQIAVGIILDLHDQLAGARHQLRSLMHAIDSQNSATKRAIAQACQRLIDGE